MIPLVILVGADKGGVGKTTVARALADWLDAAKTAARIFDTEHPSGALVRFRPGAAIVDLASVPDQLRVFDGVSEHEVTVVDIRAGLLSPTLAALDAARMLDDVRAGTVNLALLHVLGPTVQSLGEIADAARTIGGGAKHYLVKNNSNGTGFELANDPRYREQFARMGPVTIDVPQLTPVACSELDRHNLGFAAFAADGTRSRMLRGYVRTWLDYVFAEFDRVGLGSLIAA
jgi:hypothetical protein